MNKYQALALCFVFMLLFAQISSVVSALSPEQKSLYNKNVLYYDLGCSSAAEVTSGVGEPDGAIFPDLDPAVMANAINKFIKRENPNSKLKGLGETIVAGGENSNINPFLIVAHAYMESGLANPGVSDIFDRGNNAFGRSALTSQPHIVSQGAAGAPSIWYKWSSVKASVDYTAHENQNAAGGGDIASYLREQYGSILNKGDLTAYIGEYAPDGNEAIYIQNITKWVKQMAKLAGGGAASTSGGAPTSASPATCCASGSSVDADAGLVGSTNGEKAFNYFVSQGLSPEGSAGIVGNFMQESGGGTEDLDTHADNGTHTGIAQWDNAGRWPALVEFAEGKNIDPYSLRAQLDYTWEELNGDYSGTLNGLKNASSPEDAATEFEATFEISGGSALAERQANARKIFNKYGGNAGGTVSPISGGCESAVGDANMQQTITIDTPGRFISLPSRYGCGGTQHKIDSRIAAAVAYIVLKYNLCITAGLEDGHLSHGAGVAIDVVPKNGSSKSDWENTAEAAARDIGWFGDGASDPQGSKNSCANYDGGYGQCMHSVYPDKFPKWMRWMGYNGAVLHGDPWHCSGGGCGPHLHIGWDTPNGDGTSSTIIPEPRASVFTFPAPVPDDLKGLVD